MVYDASEADSDAFAHLIFGGPMVNPDLPAYGWHKFGHDGDSPRALDDVGVGRYESLLRAIPGVRFGRVVGGVVAWDCESCCGPCLNSF